MLFKNRRYGNVQDIKSFLILKEFNNVSPLLTPSIGGIDVTLQIFKIHN